MNKNSMMAAVQVDAEKYNSSYQHVHNKQEEELIQFTFPASWSREDYLAFVAEWKETYRIHSELSRLAKRNRKRVHNTITEAEAARLSELRKHPSVTAETLYNGRFSTMNKAIFWPYDLKTRARVLLALRRAGKLWAGQRTADLRKAA